MPDLHRLPDGEFIDYGRHWRLFGKQGEGPARHYSGEAAEVMRILLEKENRAGGELSPREMRISVDDHAEFSTPPSTMSSKSST
jgi:hypothetical protein